MSKDKLKSLAYYLLIILVVLGSGSKLFEVALNKLEIPPDSKVEKLFEWFFHKQTGIKVEITPSNGDDENPDENLQQVLEEFGSVLFQQEDEHLQGVREEAQKAE